MYMYRIFRYSDSKQKSDEMRETSLTVLKAN